MRALRALLELGTAGLLLGLPLVFSTHLADAVMAPKQALFQLGAAAVAVAWAAGAAAGAFPWRPPSLLAACGILLYGWGAASGLLHGLPPTAVAGTVDGILLALVLLAWTSTLDKERARRWTLYACAAALLAGLYSHLQRAGLDWVQWNNPHLSRERTIGTFGNPDYLASYLVAVLPLAMAEVLSWKDLRARGAGLAAWLAVALAMILTVTRAAWVGAAAGALVWVAGLALARRGRALAWVLVGLALLSALVVGVALRQPGDSPFTVAARLRSFTDFQDLSFRTRIFFWRAAAGIVAEHPVLGAGPGGFPAASLAYRALEPVETRHPPRVPENPHNQYLTVAAESGLPGALLLGATLALFAWRTARRLDRGWPDLGLLAAGAAHWADHAFISSTLPVETLWVFLLARAAAPDEPPEVPDPGSWSPLTAGAGAVLLALMAVLSFRLVSSERHVWLGDDDRIRARTMIEGRRHVGREILEVYQGALAHYMEAADQAPAWKRADAWWRVGNLYEEVYLGLSGETGQELWEAGVEGYRAATRADPAWAPGWAGLAGLLARRPETRAQALVPLNQALDLDPRNPTYLALRAQTLADLGRLEESLETWRQALEIFPDLPSSLLGQARALCLAGRRREAETSLDRAVALDPQAAGAAAEIRRHCGPARP